ncbi:hypothetical protein C4G43_RS24135 [Vibrio parahaemolyticus]|nr:hypothetical protein [Vibrio parahaemolyticus]
MPRFAGGFIRIFGWFGRLVSLAQSRFGCICQSANNLGSCLGKSPLFCAAFAKKGCLLKEYRVASLAGKWTYSLLVWRICRSSEFELVIWFRKLGQYFSSLPSKSTDCAKT